MPAPVALFVYNRPSHTHQTLRALRANAHAELTDLFIFSDAPKTEVEQEAVNEVRRIISEVTGFQSLTLILRDTNQGLANSIVDGVTMLCSRFGRVIVLEDDLLCASTFLQYMNQALDKYEPAQDVYSVTGYSFTSGMDLKCPAYFLPFTSSWGWGTWGQKWGAFSRDTSDLERALKSSPFRHRFDYNGAYPFSNMAENQLRGGSDSWAIFWYFSIFQRSGLTLFPSDSLIKNIGADGSGTHHNAAGSADYLTTYLPCLPDRPDVDNEISKIVWRVLMDANRLALPQGRPQMPFSKGLLGRLLQAPRIRLRHLRARFRLGPARPARKSES